MSTLKIWKMEAQPDVVEQAFLAWANTPKEGVTRRVISVIERTVTRMHQGVYGPDVTWIVCYEETRYGSETLEIGVEDDG